MKRWYLLFWIFMGVSQIIAQDYQITFAVLGGNEKPDSVRVENLDQSVSITLNGQDVLHLVGVISGLEEHQADQTALRVYPNPVTNDAVLTFYNPDAGDVAIEVSSVEGRRLLHQVYSLSSGLQAYSLRGLGTGTYIITAHAEAFRSSAIVISMVEGDAEISVSTAHIQNEDHMLESVLKSTRETSTTIQMQYNDQEVIRFSSYLDDHFDELEFVPDQYLEIAFDFSPMAAFLVDKTVVAMDSVIIFTDESENGPSGWLWNFGDGSSSTEQDPSHSYITAGTYSVSLTASNAYGSDTATRTDLILVTEPGNEGDYIQFNPELSYDTVSDIEGNTYKTIRIGNQIWMAENLRVTTYADGSAIPLMEDPDAWADNDFDDTAYCWYDNDTSYREIYGALYTWGASMHGAVSSDANPSEVQGVCPDGWHLPSDHEWKELEMYLGMSETDVETTFWRGADEGGKLRETGSNHWASSEISVSNESGFTSLPAGMRTFAGRFQNIEQSTYYHSATVKDEIYRWGRQLIYYNEQVGRPYNSRKTGSSVRCVKDRSVAPVAFFNVSLTDINPGQSVQFTDKSYNAPTGWLWDFGDGSSSTDQHPTHYYSTPGTYTVSLTVSNALGSDHKIKTDHIAVIGSLFNPDLTYETLTDVDGNTYKTIRIGNQVWMAEDLRTTTYADGTAIPLVEEDSVWKALNPDDMAYCWYDNDSSNRYVYGALYNWGASMHGTVSSDANPSGVQGVCPDGWHLPGDSEWKELEMYLGMSLDDAEAEGNIRGSDEGGALKEAGMRHWGIVDTTATNESGFTGIPGGYRHNWGSFSNLGRGSYYQSSTEIDTLRAWDRMLISQHAMVGRNPGYRQYGYSVRCVEDRTAAAVAVFSALSTEADPGEIIQFTDGSYNVPTSWEWDFGDGSSSTDQHPTHIYTALGSYTVSLIVSNSLGSDTVIREDYILVVSPLFNPDLEYGTLSDTDGNTYKTIQIGNQVWMAENLRATTYSDGTAIPLVEDSTTWSALGVADIAYCWNNNEINFAYGALYNWAAAMHGAASSDANPSTVQGVCPDGWHLPGDLEWKELEMYLGMSQAEAEADGNFRGTDEGGKLKETGIRHWPYPNSNGTNESGFTGTPGGVRYYNGSFYSLGQDAYFHTSTANTDNYVWYRRLNDYWPNVMRRYTDRRSGFSVRCVEDRTGAPVAALAAPSTEVDMGELIHFTDQTYNVPTSWQWDFGDGSGSTDQHPTHSYTTLGTYTVSLEVSNAFDSDTVVRKDYINVVSPLFNPGLTYGTMSDIDGNTYKTIQIGDQEWMAENLRVTTYADGTPILLVENETVWSALGMDDIAYCWNNNEINFAYGALYNWAAAMHGAASSDANPSGVQGVCPDGWHLPGDSEWKQLEMYLGMSQVEADAEGNNRGIDEADKLKETGGRHWIYPRATTTNESGFTGLPGGSRNNNGSFNQTGYNGSFQSSTASRDNYSWIRGLNGPVTVSRIEFYNKYGGSVRCVKD
ncbi:MAG: FISUMP domain-containing protein [Bacteroidota bacterium]